MTFMNHDNLKIIRSHLEQMGASHIETTSTSLRVQFRIKSTLYKVCIFRDGHHLVCETPFYRTTTRNMPSRAKDFLLKQNSSGSIQYALTQGDGDNWVVTARAMLPSDSTSPYHLKSTLDDIHHAYETTIRTFKSLVDN